MRRVIPISQALLLEAFRRFPIYNLRAFLDAESGHLVEVPEDLIDYCMGRDEGTDLQLSDSHELPLAQRIAEEVRWLEQGFDDDGVGFDAQDQRYFPIQPVGGLPEADVLRHVEKWLDEWDLQTQN